MRCILFILICIFFPRFECQSEPTDSYFVARRDTDEAICISPLDNDYLPFPTFDLDKLHIPLDAGTKNINWLSEWQLQNVTNVHLAGYSKVLIAGNQPFHFVAKDYRGRGGRAYVYILASNITLWMVEKNESRGAGMLFEVDHLNETTKLNDTTLKYCDKNPEVEGANCTIVDYKNGTNLLNDGNRWNVFTIKLQENRTGVALFQNYEPVVEWTWNNTNISNPFTSDSFDVFAKSHQRNAALENDNYYEPDLANITEMKRKHTKRSSGKMCIEVYWNEKISNDSNELMEVKNFASGQVQPGLKKTHAADSIFHLYYTFFEWNHLDAGEYEFNLRFDNRKPAFINLCRDDVTKIVKTWTSIPKAITKCQFRVSKSNEYFAGPASPRDLTLKPNWTQEQWAYVCDQLGIGSNDTEVPIELCNLNGCNSSKCAHLQE